MSEVVVGAAGYAVNLDVYDGPLDLLLQLIRKEELDIFDIPIARLTGAYLATLDTMRAEGVEPASEFLVMAATLLQIKSRMLLPRPNLDDVEMDEDPRDALVIQLLEYQRFREVADQLGGCVQLGRDVFSRADGLDRPQSEAELAAQDIYRLAEAFRGLVNKGQYEAPHDIYVERISIAERIAQIGEKLAAEGKVTFADLCATVRYREEIITTFLALLEMARLRLIRTVQRERLGPLYLEAQVEEIEARGERAAGMLED